MRTRQRTKKDGENEKNIIESNWCIWRPIRWIFILVPKNSYKLFSFHCGHSHLIFVSIQDFYIILNNISSLLSFIIFTHDIKQLIHL